MRRNDAGAALLEVIIALAILATAAASMLAVATQAARAVERVRAAEAEIRAANAFLTAVSLWTREDLDRRLGDREQGAWRLRVDRPAETLYVVILSDSLERELLRTSLYRPRALRDE